MSAATVGAVLASRRPRHPVGWLLLTLGLSVLAYHVVDGYARYGLLGQPGALPLASFALEPVCIGLILVLTPTGSLPSPGWRWWARGLVLALVGFLLAVLLGSEPLEPPLQGSAVRWPSPPLPGRCGSSRT